MTKIEKKPQKVRDLKKEFEIGLVVDSHLSDDATLTYIIEYEDKNGDKQRTERQPYQIIYL